MVATAPSPVPRPRGEARRIALLEAALRIVAAVGVDAVTHRRVAEEAGLPLASTTYWFDSKEHLLAAAVELAAERDLADLRERVASPVTPAIDPVDAVVELLLGSESEDPAANRGTLLASYTLLLEAARRPALQAVAARWTDGYIDGLSVLLAAAGSRQSRADAQLLLAASDGLQIEQLATGVTSNLTSRLRRVARALLAQS